MRQKKQEGPLSANWVCGGTINQDGGVIGGKQTSAEKIMSLIKERNMRCP